jgi:hypothetical protein
VRDVDKTGEEHMKAFPNLVGQLGMDLRDYFAAKAMQAMLASPELLVIVTADEVLGDNSRERCARCAYNFADAMMKAREEK